MNIWTEMSPKGLCFSIIIDSVPYMQGWSLSLLFTVIKMYVLYMQQRYIGRLFSRSWNKKTNIGKL